MNQTEQSVKAAGCGLAGDIVRTFGEVRLRVFGTSMAPAILPGDLIYVRRVILSEMSVGSIVLYARDERIFAHRVVGFSSSPAQTVLVTRGDRLCYNDPMVSPDELLGKVISVERRGRQVRVNSPTNVFAIALAQMLRNSNLATRAYVKLAFVWESFACSAFPRRRSRDKASREGTMDSRPEPLDTEDVARCQA